MRRQWLHWTGACLGLLALSHVARAETIEGEEVSLPALQAFAMRNAPEVRLAEQRRALGAAARVGASAALAGNPTLEVAAGPRLTGSGPSDYDLMVSLAQPLEVAGERGLRRLVAERVVGRLDAEAEAARWSVTRALAQTYRAAQAARARVAHADRRVAFATEIVAIARRRTTAGDGTSIDERLAEAELAQAQLGRLEASRALWAARVRLCELSGWPLERPPQPAALAGAIEPPPPLARLLAQVGPAHPAIRARRAAEGEAQARIVLADREVWPVPSFGVSLAREGSAGSPANFVLLGSLAVSLPTFRRNQGARAEARAGAAVATAETDATLAGLRARIAGAHGEVTLAAERISLVERASGALDESLRLVRRAFEAGQLSLADLSVARERLLGIEAAAIAARADHDAARAALDEALGQAGGAP